MDGTGNKCGRKVGRTHSYENVECRKKGELSDNRNGLFF